MKLINGNIDHLFKEKLSEHNAVPSEDVWSRLENDLTSKKKAVIPLFLKVAAAIIVLLSVGGLIFKFSGEPVDYEQISEEIQLPAHEIKIEKDLQYKNIESQSKTPKTAISKKQDEIITNQKIEKSKPETGLEYIAVRKEETITSENGMSLAYQNSLESDIENIYLVEGSDMLIKNDLTIKAIPVYQTSQTGSYALIYAEDKNSEKKRAMQWSVGGQAGPQYTYRNIIVNDPASQTVNLDDYESGVVTYAGGFNVRLETSRRFTIQSGVYYSKIGTNKAEIYASGSVSANRYSDDLFESTPTDIANSTGSFIVDKTLTNNTILENTDVEYVKGPDVVKEYFEYLEIPLVVRYRFINRKLGIDLNGGLWTNFLIGFDATSTSDQPLNITETPENINKINFSGSIGIGFDYPITKSVLFNLEPIFKYYLSPINNLDAVQVHPYSFGIMAGIRYSF